ncbi:leucine-rich repeat and IQ domain-containing protein 3 isoform X1 [Tachysurus fulvidraco]|uniref:leucine-rich repeat and IQ domain-containing protein 3 isoform X1 n=1 Tax=Tachysurus fulvidraco TaxID=1234273 RepID=UPI000F504B70|nr:leucine-rich repeat and IQ domain-containing protein 3 isoform X1 [Tachysurus fulvidraco]
MEDIRIKTDLNLDDGHSSSLLSSSSSLSSVCAEQDVLVVRMCALQLYSLSGVCVFRALRVCVLCDNSITDIQPLQQCVNLLKLDLKGNQISQLPEAAFWKNLKNLQLLFLHDNNISVMNHVSGLSVSPSLSALTLYETPLSRTRNYRHCVINSIISLKALDHHVISDEEIIENWKLPLRYQAMAPNLSLILYSSATTQSDEIKALHRIISEINRVQASFSPTLIIQKWIRGHLTRKHLGLCGAPVPLKTLVRNVTSVSSVWDISRRSWIRSDPHILELQKDMLSIRSFHSKNLTDIKPPCNTPQPHNHGNNLNISFLDEHPGEMMGLKTYCLFGCKAMTYLSKPFEDMLISRKRDGQDIRDGIIHFHKQKSDRPTAPWPRPPNITAEKHLNRRFHKYLKPTTIQPTDRAYKEREKEESLRERAQRVMKVQDQRDEARGRREGFMAAQRREALQRQKWEQDKLETTLKLQTAKQEQEVQLVHQKYRRFLVEKQMNMMEQEAVKRFSRQHGALSKAFSKHYTEHKLDKTLHERRRRIATQNAGLQAVQRHLENRQQSKPMMSWTSINSLPFQQLTDINQTSHYKPAEIQPIRGRLTGDRSAKHNGHKTRFLKLVETKVDLGMTKQV